MFPGAWQGFVQMAGCRSLVGGILLCEIGGVWPMGSFLLLAFPFDHIKSAQAQDLAVASSEHWRVSRLYFPATVEVQSQSAFPALP